MNQVQINPTKLSILSINRSRYWIFKSAILEFLYAEVDKAGGNEFEGSGSESDEDEDELEDRLSFLNLTSKPQRNSLYDSSSSSASFSTPRRGKKHGSVSSMSSFNLETKEIDNSSKRHSVTNTNPAPTASNTARSDSNESDSEGPEAPNYFFHIAFTPIECTIICATTVMHRLFKEPLKACQELNYNDVTLVEQQFVNLQIDSGGGSDNNYRILQLTKPLSENNISLFFLSSHFSDIVLIPHHLEDKVVSILTQSNFEFNDLSGSYIINNNFNPIVAPSHDESSKGLEDRVFKLFKDSNIKPCIDKNVSLLLTGSRSNDVAATILKAAANLAANNIPDYFAITRTSQNEVSLILPRSSKKRSKMGFQSRFLIGSTQDIINPVTIDLQKLPLDSTGIVAGVASKIFTGINSLPGSDYPFELNFLSMARSAILMIPKENVELVNEILSSIDYDNL
ncbi:hypothetical protein PSN45_002591 [Yamadazyma tenuis]|uniref:uncharacterized protein n=1 Tax=Candida tenuis TaxID=2315449 RepID=UPI0027A25338|nr:hypothetical protein PSN45_002591 [Yamadazyma tenuis]